MSVERSPQPFVHMDQIVVCGVDWRLRLAAGRQERQKVEIQYLGESERRRSAPGLYSTEDGGGAV